MFICVLAVAAVLFCGACKPGQSSTAPRDPGGTPPIDSAGLVGASAFRVFPPDNWWNTNIAAAPVDDKSATLIASCGVRGLHPDFGTVYGNAPNGIPFIIVPGTQPKVPVSFDYADESDPGPYPVPSDAPIEGGAASTGDRHVLVIDVDHKLLYELYAAYPQNGGASWRAGSGAVFDLTSNALRPMYATSADAAGLPIFAGLVRYDEAVLRQSIPHALRFTCPRTRRAFVDPARHYASGDTSSSLPPMGMRVRLKASFDVTPFPPEVQAILGAMKAYGMMVADNGSGWFVSGAPDPRWQDANLATLRNVPSSAFEVVKMGVVHY